MKSDLEIKIKLDIDHIRHKLPVSIDMYIEFNSDGEMEYTTLLSYLIEIKCYLEYLSSEVLYKNILDISLDDLGSIDEGVARNYLRYSENYTKKLYDLKGNVREINFTNSKNSKARKLAILNNFYKFYLKRKILKINPFEFIEIKIVKKDFISYRLSPAEVAKIENNLLNCENIDSQREKKAYIRQRNRDAAILLLLAYTGIRVSELVQLDIDDVNLDTGDIRIIRKGGKLSEVPYPPIIKEFVNNYLSERIKLNTSNKALFLSQQNNRIHPKTVRNIVAKYAKRSNISTKVTCHTFRRTLFTNLYNSTGDIYLVKELAGHSSADTTLKHYSAITKNHVKKAMDNFIYKEED